MRRSKYAMSERRPRHRIDLNSKVIQLYDREPTPICPSVWKSGTPEETRCWPALLRTHRTWSNSQTIRTTSYLLHPPLLDENGLSQAILWYMQGLMARSGLESELDVAEDFGRLPADLELTVFRRKL